MGAMARLVRDGKVRAIGLSNFSVRAMRAAQAALGEQRLASLQMEYNLWDRMAEEHFLPHCEQEELTLIAYSPLDQGRISAGSERLRALEAIAAKHEKTAAQIALAWLIRHPRVVAIPKASNPKHVRENAEAAEIALSDEEAEAISRAFSGKPSLVPTDRIRVVTDASHPAYRTVDEARRNALGFTPSPQELADDVLVGDPLKPVRLVRTTDVSGAFDYDLIEGRIRYWGWVIAHNGARPIPSLIRE